MTQKELNKLFNLSFNDFQKIMSEHRDYVYLSDKYSKFRKNLAEFLLNVDPETYNKFINFSKG